MIKKITLSKEAKSQQQKFFRVCSDSYKRKLTGKGNQCSFNAKYVPIIEGIAKEKSVEFKAIHLESKEDAQKAPTPITTYALFLDGNYITNEQMNDNRFLKLLDK